MTSYLGRAVRLVLLLPIAALARDYTNFVRLYSFDGPSGANPCANLIEGNDGKLYGTAAEGGLVSDTATNGMGTLFRLNKDGTGFKVLHYFGKKPGDGYMPLGGLVEGRFGALYGTTREGGRFGKGTIFKLDKNGHGYYVLHHFSGGTKDGAHPSAGLLRIWPEPFRVVPRSLSLLPRHDPRGYVPPGLVAAELAQYTRQWTGGGPGKGIAELYGTTESEGRLGRGTIFKLFETGSGYRTMSWLETMWGAYPKGPGSVLAVGTNGALYGTAFNGASTEAPSLPETPVNGTVFWFNRTNSNVAADNFLFNPWPWTGVICTCPFFPPEPAPNLSGPAGGLIIASDDRIYGTALGGGPNLGGAIFFGFTFGPYSLFLVQHPFADADGAGVYPMGGLIEGPDGALYGTTSSDYVNAPPGADRFYGTVFRINKDGTGLTVLKRFMGTDGDGAAPQAKLLFGEDGSLYGTTSAGGDSASGIIFALRAGQ